MCTYFGTRQTGATTCKKILPLAMERPFCRREMGELHFGKWPRMMMSRMSWIPKGFTQVEKEGWHALVRLEHRDTLAAVLLGGQGLEPLPTSWGRGPLWQFRLEQDGGVLRQYRRGGLLRSLLPEGYFASNRPLRELCVWTHLYENGLSVPEPLGACWERRFGFYRGAIAARRVEARPLSTLLDHRTNFAEAKLGEVGRLIRALHDRKVAHGDLQVANILINPDTVYVIDFDKARWPIKMSRFRRARNLLRLRRSLEKIGFPPAYFGLICQGYGVESMPRWLDSLYRFKGKLSDLFARVCS